MATSLPAALAETHCAVVFFVGDRAYKIKKPVDLGFVDFRTPESRWRACRRELELNRRFAPDVYLDLGELRLERASEPVVVMRRLPAERSLAALVRSGAPVDDALRQLAKQLAVAQACGRSDAQIAAAGREPALRSRWESNLAGIAPFAGSVLPTGEVQAVARMARQYLDGRATLLDERADAGLVRDGHGDLLAEDVFCLPDGPRVLDCLDFDDRLRWVDGLDDAAFLAMDLERLGDEASAERFLRWYQEFTGVPPVPSLAHHYIAYRAVVRVKVACLRHAQGGGGADEARLLLRQARRHLHLGTVRLLLVGGLPGTGKSTVAASLADRLGATVLRTDVVRREVVGAPAAAPASVPAFVPASARVFGTGRYTRARTRRVYRSVLDRAGALLSRGETVVLDASWHDPAARAEARDLAGRHAADLVELQCVVPDGIAAARLRRRGPDASEATEAIATRMAAEFAPWPEAAVLRTTDPPERLAATVLRALGFGPPPKEGADR